MKRLFLRSLAAVVMAGFAVVAQAGDKYIVVQSTTSTQNSGLYDHLLPIFEEKSGIEVRVVAVGTGQAIKNAMNGDGDVLLVHAKASEEKFVAEGFGVKRFDLMYNDFVVVGPAADPAGIAGSSDIVAALGTIAEGGRTFVSRGDDSGTHKKELALWREARVETASASGSWYRESGSGMGATLNIAVGMDGYTLTDRATWIKFGNKANHKIVVEGDKRLFNQYGVILVDKAKHPNVKAELGQVFIDWLLSPEGQRAIAAYKVNGEPLFVPNAAVGS
jgi:tungstate transport system substrate-binding protein